MELHAHILDLRVVVVKWVVVKVVVTIVWQVIGYRMLLVDPQAAKEALEKV